MCHEYDKYDDDGNPYYYDDGLGCRVYKYDRPPYNKNYNVPSHIHIMNKNEAKVMRRLKNETGLTEVEIRKVKKYRIMLSEAQKEGQKGKGTRVQKARDEVMKYVCRKLKLAKEHPDVQKAYREEWERRRKEYVNRPWCNSSIYQESPK